MGGLREEDKGTALNWLVVRTHCEALRGGRNVI